MVGIIRASSRREFRKIIKIYFQINNSSVFSYLFLFQRMLDICALYDATLVRTGSKLALDFTTLYSIVEIKTNNILSIKYWSDPSYDIALFKGGSGIGHTHTHTHTHTHIYIYIYIYPDELLRRNCSRLVPD